MIFGCGLFFKYFTFVVWFYFYEFMHVLLYSVVSGFLMMQIARLLLCIVVLFVHCHKTHKTEFSTGVMLACMNVDMMDLLSNPFCSFMSSHIELHFVKRRPSGSSLCFCCRVMSLSILGQ